ncbi:MAG TPA: PilZ domain-containing protein [Rhodanobacteraceae bacterium]|nr:PilZ domain-containing protein [Rhodanobacteraceae bacterium]
MIIDLIATVAKTPREGMAVTSEEGTRGRARSARMPMQSTVLLSRGADAWTTDIEDISASGVLVRRPDGWAHAVGVLFALDMMIGENLNIHVEATVARVTAEHVGFAYTRIPADKEVPLWNLLGGYADRLEYFRN